METIVTNIFALDLGGELWIKNVVILSYIQPKGINTNISGFLFRINSMLFNLLAMEKPNKSQINSLLSLLRRFCSNVFQSQNGSMISQVLDKNLAKLVLKILTIAKHREHRDISLTELLKMLNFFVVDDSILEILLENNLRNNGLRSNGYLRADENGENRRD